MKRLILCAVTVCMGCSPKIINEPPLKYSFMPKYLDIDSIGIELPPDPDTLVSKDAIDFKPRYVEGGTFISDSGDTSYLLPGLLISERSSVRYVFYEAGYRRQQVELDYSKRLTQEYYEKSLEAEKLYQDEIKRLRELSERSWLEKNLGYIGFVAGIATMAIQQFAVIKMID